MNRNLAEVVQVMHNADRLIEMIEKKYRHTRAHLGPFVLPVPLPPSTFFLLFPSVSYPLFSLLDTQCRSCCHHQVTWFRIDRDYSRVYCSICHHSTPQHTNFIPPPMRPCQCCEDQVLLLVKRATGAQSERRVTLGVVMGKIVTWHACLLNFTYSLRISTRVCKCFLWKNNFGFTKSLWICG